MQMEQKGQKQRYMEKESNIKDSIYMTEKEQIKKIVKVELNIKSKRNMSSKKR